MLVCAVDRLSAATAVLSQACAAAERDSLVRRVRPGKERGTGTEALDVAGGQPILVGDSCSEPWALHPAGSTLQLWNWPSAARLGRPSQSGQVASLFFGATDATVAGDGTRWSIWSGACPFPAFQSLA